MAEQQIANELRGMGERLLAWWRQDARPALQQEREAAGAQAKYGVGVPTLGKVYERAFRAAARAGNLLADLAIAGRWGSEAARVAALPDDDVDRRGNVVFQQIAPVVWPTIAPELKWVGEIHSDRRAQAYALVLLRLAQDLSADEPDGGPESALCFTGAWYERATDSTARPLTAEALRNAKKRGDLKRCRKAKSGANLYELKEVCEWRPDYAPALRRAANGAPA